ncbi:MAG: TrkA-C domain protein [Firmicutes bacterium]|nr:TrkA-C domain protein [Bacillota bacterium]
MAKSVASYQSIALDIAKRIINDEFPVGTKISGRTLLSSQYSVSPETIRKAIGILKNANIVNVSQGKEITILSSQQAYNLIEHHKEIISAYSLKQELEMLLEKKEETDRQFRKIVTEIMRYSDRLKNLDPYNPVEIRISPNTAVVGKSLETLDLWHNTGATIVAIRRETEIMISPSPDTILQCDDRIVVVGSNAMLQNVFDFINQ